MARWWAVVAVVFLGGLWFALGIWGEDPAAAMDTRPVVLTPPAAADQAPVTPPAAQPEPALKRSAPEPTPAAAAPPRVALAEVSRRAARLVSEGRSDQAIAFLRQERQKARTPDVRGRLAFELAPLVGDLAERRLLLSEALAVGSVRGAEYDQVRDMLRELNRNPGQSLLGLLEVGTYEVAPGDSLWKLCNRTFPETFGVSPEVGLLRQLNGFSGSNIQVGQRLVVPLATLEIRIDRVRHGLTAFLGDVAVLAYQVGLGKENRTPRGQFVVEVKQEKPTWYRNGQAIPHGDPQNILGTRWMGFENHPGATGYGIHGTERPESIGLDESMGCVRMRNAEVEELFEIVPRGTVVTIP